MSAWERPAPPKGGDEWLDRSRAARPRPPMTQEEVDDMIRAAMDRHAHRLAEKIREAARERSRTPRDRLPESVLRDDWAADLIDPEVSR